LLGGWGEGLKPYGNHPKVALSDALGRVANPVAGRNRLTLSLVGIVKEFPDDPGRWAATFQTSDYKIKGLRPPQVFAFGGENAIKRLIPTTGSA
jgi:hypothetical protein